MRPWHDARGASGSLCGDDAEGLHSQSSSILAPTTYYFGPLYLWSVLQIDFPLYSAQGMNCDNILSCLMFSRTFNGVLPLYYHSLSFCFQSKNVSSLSLYSQSLSMRGAECSF